jgi:hypothetical protein
LYRTTTGDLVGMSEAEAACAIPSLKRTSNRITRLDRVALASPLQLFAKRVGPLLNSLAYILGLNPKLCCVWATAKNWLFCSFFAVFGGQPARLID